MLVLEPGASIRQNEQDLKSHDHLSMRLTTDTSGNPLAQQGHYPYGESWYSQSTTTKFQFTSYERDAESGNDYALARLYINRIARFGSPDPIPGSVLSPDSLNRYAYTFDDPINLSDPIGLSPCGDEPGMRPCPLLIEGGDPLGFGCVLDGISVGCSWVSRSTISEVAVQCPNNACQRAVWRSDTETWVNQFFAASVNGTGNYYAFAGPGALYAGFLSAGIAAGLAVDEASGQNEKVEWGAEIYKDEQGFYSFTDPRPGTPTSYEVDPRRIPPGAVLVGDVHTHLRGASYTFSLGDTIRINATHAGDPNRNYQGAFLVPHPGDVIWVYRPGIDTGWGNRIWRRPR